MFLIKKLIGPLLFPIPFASFLLIVGLVLLWFTRKQKLGKQFVSAGTVILISLSFGMFAPWTLAPLERKYQPLLNPASIAEVDAPIKWIVVLGGGGASSSQLPSTSQLSPASLSRLSEGIRLHRQIPDSKIILSEGAVFQAVPVADLMARMAEDLGIPRDDLILEQQSRDTEGQAQLILPLVGKDRFVLVTSAAHMPRSMALFRKLGMNPIAAPTDFKYLTRDTLSPSSFYPSAGELRKAELAMHEYMGLAWAKLRGKI